MHRADLGVVLAEYFKGIGSPPYVANTLLHL